jgi:hypothetical protein
MKTNNNDFRVVTQEDINDSILNQFGFKLGDNVLVPDISEFAGIIFKPEDDGKIWIKFGDTEKDNSSLPSDRIDIHINILSSVTSYPIQWLISYKFKVLPRYKQIKPEDVYDYLYDKIDVFIKYDGDYNKITGRVSPFPNRIWEGVSFYNIEGELDKNIDVSNIFDYEYYIKE